MRTIPISRVRDWLSEAPRALLYVVGIVAAAALIVTIVVIAIPNTDHGTVIGRKYHEAYDVYVAESKTCLSYDSTGNCTYYSTTPAHTDHYPERWTVRVEDEAGEQETLGVSETIYLGCSEGMWYPGEGLPCRATQAA